jgi:hypothetical protein
MRTILFSIYILAISFFLFAQVSSKPIPSYKNFIGKTFSDIKTIDTALTTSQFGMLESNNQYGVSIYCDKNYADKHGVCRIFQVFFTKTVGKTEKHPIDQILDVVTIDMKKYSKYAQVWLDQCSKSGTKYFETVAVYYHDEDMANKGIKVKPEKAWHPNVKTGKLEEVPPTELNCWSEPPNESP